MTEKGISIPRSVKTGRAAAVEKMDPWLAMDPDFAVFTFSRRSSWLG